MESHIEDLSNAGSMAIDLEFDRDHYTYGFDLCLLQVATDKACYLVDPKLGAPVENLFPLFESDRIQKIAHCSGEDLRLLHSLNCYPKNFIDTEIYAKLLNYERTSLSALLNLFFDVELNKKMQKINWTLRPLSAEQIEYAAEDVIYLASLKKIFDEEAFEKKLDAFIAEENELLSTTIYSNEPKTNFLKPNDMRFLSEYDQHVLNGMFRFRDDLARKHNKPAHHIIREALVRATALGKPYDTKDLEAVHYSLKSPNGRKAFFQKLSALQEEADKKQLSKKRPGKLFNSTGIDTSETVNREWIDEQKSKFKEIQKAIAEKYGENSMRFILSSGLVSTLVNKQINLSQLKTASRRKIITETAGQLQIDLSPYM